MAYCSSFFLLSRSLTSPSGTGSQSNSASALTRGANDSIACLFAFVRWDTRKRCKWLIRRRSHTSQFSRIKQRPPATDLSGPKASAESLTPRRSNLAEADAVDFQPFFLIRGSTRSNTLVVCVRSVSLVRDRRLSRHEPLVVEVNPMNQLSPHVRQSCFVRFAFAPSSIGA
jgi:hypothetical protein